MVFLLCVMMLWPIGGGMEMTLDFRAGWPSLQVWPTQTRWDLQVLWQPCGTSQWPELAGKTLHLSGGGLEQCQYAETQRVLAFAKSADAKRGFLLLTRAGEIGIFSQQGLETTPFKWQSLSTDRWYLLRAVGGNGTTSFYCNGRRVGTVSGDPGNYWPERFAGDLDAKNPQGAGRIRRIRFRLQQPQNNSANTYKQCNF
ncbi:unnamed protein product [Durusdinium trenchii]|uniref:Uncharacterized protein n=2 Tax=Durusdinium trenchii TaxID=1381693 RepID=A0ABP0SUT7_9DINO